MSGNKRREQFLHAPGESELRELSGELRELASAAEAALEAYGRTQRGEDETRRLILREGPGRPPTSRASTTKNAYWPKRTRWPLPVLQRDRRRTTAPRAAALVPPLMQELFDHLAKLQPGVPRAIWGHVQFETIHPFGDGNGRTGRALLQAGLQTSLPISPFILREPQTYYRLFQESDWPQWLAWLCRGIVEQHGLEGQGD